MRAILLLLLLAPATIARADAPWTGPPVIVTGGEAEVRAAPDRALVRLTTEARAPTAKAAQQQEAAAMNAVQKQLTEMKIPAAAVRTLAYDLQLEFDYAGGKQTPRGYVARHVIEVRLDDLAQLGDLIGKAVESGAAAVSGIEFDVKARAELERQALKQAVEDARARAEAMAAGAGKAIAGVIRLEEVRQHDGPRPLPMARAMVKDEAVATPIVAGEIEIKAAVTLTSSLQ
jgi:uncharacterized protein YggE